MIVEKLDNKRWVFVFHDRILPGSLVKITECCLTLLCIKLCHTSCPQELSIYVKDRPLKWLWRRPKVHTRKRNRSF